MMDDINAIMIRKQIVMNTAILGAIITWTAGVFATYYGGGPYAPTLCFAAALLLMVLPYSQLHDGWARRITELVNGSPDVPYYSELSEEVENRV